MKFNCNYIELLEILIPSSGVAEDSLSNEDMKNIIFKLERGTPNKASVISVNQLITFKQFLSMETYSLELEDEELDDEGVLYLQIKSKELLNFLNAYKGLRRTKVEEVCFKFNSRNNILCTVLEKDIDSEAVHTSRYVFENLPMKSTVKKSVSLNAPTEGLNTIESKNILVHTRNMLPILQSSSQTPTSSNLLFGEDHVVAIHPSFVTIMSNLVNNDIFRGIKLSQRVLVFIDKTLCTEDVVTVARLREHIYFQTLTSETFIKYDTKLMEYKYYLDMFKKDHALVLDRIYLKDVLRRLSLANDTIEFTIMPEEGVVRLSNSKFDQEIPIIKDKALAEIGKIQFRVMPEVLTKAIIGSDDEFSGNSFVYYCADGRNVSIIFADDSGSWFSIIRVKVKTEV